MRCWARPQPGSCAGSRRSTRAAFPKGPAWRRASRRSPRSWSGPRLAARPSSSTSARNTRGMPGRRSWRPARATASARPAGRRCGRRNGGDAVLIRYFRPWKMWHSHELRPTYDVVIIGGGVHGLATAYYLAKRGVKNIAVLEKSYIGSGGSGRNTTIIRANYRTPEGVAFYRESLRLYEHLGQ